MSPTPRISERRSLPRAAWRRPRPHGSVPVPAQRRRAGRGFLLGVMSSIPFDWYARRIVELTLTFELLSCIPVPRPDATMTRARTRVVEIAGRLGAVTSGSQTWAAAVGVPVGSRHDPTRRSELVAELDALVARLYGLSRDQLIHVFATFHRGWDYGAAPGEGARVLRRAGRNRVSLRDTFPPVFATNRVDTGETVAAEINRMLRGLREDLASPPELAIATAYLNPAGFDLVADEIEQAPVVRLLLGAEPQAPMWRSVDEASPVDLLDDGLRASRDLTGFTVEADRSARRLVAWLREAEATGKPRVEVRRFNKGFLHGKAFIAIHPSLARGSRRVVELHLRGPVAEPRAQPRLPVRPVHAARDRLVQRAVGRLRAVRPRRLLRSTVDAPSALGRVHADAARALRR